MKPTSSRSGGISDRPMAAGPPQTPRQEFKTHTGFTVGLEDFIPEQRLCIPYSQSDGNSLEFTYVVSARAGREVSIPGERRELTEIGPGIQTVASMAPQTGSFPEDPRVIGIRAGIRF